MADISALQRIGVLVKNFLRIEYGTRMQLSHDDVEWLQIDNIINLAMIASYRLAQREDDYWNLLRRLDPDDENNYYDEYHIYFLYTIPKVALNQRIAMVLETTVSMYFGFGSLGAESGSSELDTMFAEISNVTLDIAKKVLSEGILVERNQW
jgi:hypothetical protein